MPKLTDYVREGFKKRRAPWRNGETPEWWDIAVWAGLAGVIGVVVLSAAFGGGGSASDAAPNSPSQPIQSLNPYASQSAGASSAPSATPTPSSGPSTVSNPGDFSATAAVQCPQTGGGTAIVPVGARNVALAAAKAEATGDWSGIPVAGNGKPPATKKAPQGSVVGEVTVENPSVTGTTSFLFSATIKRGDGTQPYLVQIVVERAPSGYAVAPR